jgi:hypothetical protein
MKVDFQRVLTLIAEFFAREDRRFAVIGAFALQAYGFARATQDLDFVVEASCQDELIAHLASLGYETLHRSSGYSNHLHADPALGRIDFVYVDAETAAVIFSPPLRHLELPQVSVPVPRPEHVIAMKLHGITNDPSRTFRDLADVQELMQLPEIDMAEVRGYFEKYGLLERYREIRRMS